MKDEVIADLSAKVLKRVLAFAAVEDVRYYLCGAHVCPGDPAAKVSARVTATNGHMLYAEEDTSAIVMQELIVSIGRRGHALLSGKNRVKVFADNQVQITDQYGVVLYIEPSGGVIDAKFPNVQSLVGVPTDWHEGLTATCDSRYLKAALSIPGAIRFFSRKDAEGHFSALSAVMFVMDGGTPTGGKAMGIIMPMRGQFEAAATVADMLPTTLLAQRADVAEAA